MTDKSITLRRGAELSLTGNLTTAIKLVSEPKASGKEPEHFVFEPIGGGPVVLGAIGGRRGRPAKLIISGSLVRRKP